MSNCFQMMLQNIRSLTKNFDDLKVLLESLSEKPSAICLTEIWLNEFHHTESMFLESYRLLVNINRKKTRRWYCYVYLKISTSKSC